MGLDMYAWSVPADRVVDDFEFTHDENKAMKELFYWRKHHDLHGWMERLYRAKGGDKEFNCQRIRLTENDLLQLRADLKSQLLPKTTGFFFGNNPPDDYTLKNDLKFVRLALQAVKRGKAVYYDSWW